MYKRNYKEILETILNACEKNNKAIKVKDLKSIGVDIDMKSLKHYFINETIYCNYQDFCRRNGYMFDGDFKINNVIKPSKELTLEDIKILFLEYKKKYNKYPNSIICMNPNRDNLPAWHIIQDIIKKNNMSLNDFFSYIGDKDSIKSDASKYMDYIRILKNKCKTMDKVLGQRDIIHDKHNLPSISWFIKYCPDKNIKNYSQFLEWMGMKPNYYVSKELATKIIYKMQSKLDRPLMMSDLSNPTKEEIGMGTINKIWGSFNKMKVELGLEIVQEDMISKQKSEKEMLQDLQKLINKLGRLPLAKDFKEENINSASSYHKHFGGINNAFLQLGYTPNKKSIALKLSNEEIKDIYKEFIEDLGFVPAYEFCKNVYELPAPRTVIRRLDCSWNDFIKILGYKPNECIVSSCTFYAKDGTKCLSTSEGWIHNFLLNKNIKNLQKETFYKDVLDNEELRIKSGYKRFDWTFEYNNQLYTVEYFGMMSDANYKIRHDEKLELIKADNKENNFVALYPKDLKHLDEKFSFII